jgi:uncharacterized protein (TIGR02145 family)
MRNSPSKITLSAGFVLAMVFTFSCSNGDDNEGGDGDGSCDMSGYKKVEMPDGKTWMAENLNCNVSGSVCYDNDPANCVKYGRLYKWETAKKACSGGWHLPSDTEWEALVTSVGGSSTAGTKLKADSPLWNNNGNGTDEFGFSALPGGNNYSDRYYNDFNDVGIEGDWWSATEYNASLAYGRYMSYSSAGVSVTFSGKAFLYSVRCVQD